MRTTVVGTKVIVVIRLNGATVEVNEGTSRQTVQEVLLALQSTTVQGKKSYGTSVKKKKYIMSVAPYHIRCDREHFFKSHD